MKFEVQMHDGVAPVFVSGDTVEVDEHGNLVVTASRVLAGAFAVGRWSYVVPAEVQS